MSWRRALILACVTGVVGGVLPAAAFSQEGAPQLIDLWFGDNASCSNGPPSLETCGTPDVLREGQFVWICALVYDPDFILADNDEVNEEIWVGVQSYWDPYFQGGILYGPEPPSVPTDDDTFTVWGPYSHGDPVTGLITVSAAFWVPDFNGENQAKLRGFIDWDVSWLVIVGVKDSSLDPDKVLWYLLDVPVCAIENPAFVTPNPPPFADAGGDRTVAVGSRVTLNASQSFDAVNVGFDPLDPDVFAKDELTYAWEWLDGPEQVDPDPDFVDPALARVTLTELGTYTYRVTVSDQVNVPPTTDTVTITVVNADQLPNANLPPRAIISDLAGPVSVGQIATLDGTRSADPDGDVLTYRWRQVNELGGELTLEELAKAFQPVAGLNEVTSRWRAITAGTFYFRLLVTDPFGNTASDLVAIEVVDTASAAGETVDNAGGETAGPGPTSTDDPAPKAVPACGGGLLPLAVVPLVLWLARGRRR